MKENIYLIASSSFHLMEEEIKNILKGNVYSSYDLNGILLDEVLEEAAYISLFLEKKYMVVKNANIFGSSKKKSDEEKVSKKDEKLLDYLESPNSNTILIFTLNGKIDSKKKICKIIKEKYNLIEIPELKPKEIYSKIEKKLKKDGYTIDYNTLYYVINACQNNYDLVVNEVEKIKLYYSKPCEIILKDVKKIVCNNIEDNNFKFVEMIMNKNIKEAFKIYDDLMIQKIEPIMLLSMLAKEIRNTLLVKSHLNKYSKKEMMKLLNINYEFQVDKYINNSYLFKERELEDYLVLLCDLDYKIKNGKISNKLALETFILKVCM